MGGREVGLVDVTSCDGSLIVASDFGLHTFDRHLLSPLRPADDPAVNGGIPVPLAVQVVSVSMMYFASKHGVHFYDGTAWSGIEIPPELLRRDFTGRSR